MQQCRGVSILTKPLLSLGGFYSELTASRLIHTQKAAFFAYPATGLVAICQSSLLTHIRAQQPCQSISGPHAHGNQGHGRSFASQSASRLQQTANRAKRAAQAQQGSRAANQHQHEDPASNSAVDSIPQSETTVEASQSRPTTLQVTLP